MLKGKLESAEKEIETLKAGGIELLSPINVKVFEEDVNIPSTPVRPYIKSRNTSMDSFVNRSVDTSTRIKNRRAGVVGTIMAKLLNFTRLIFITLTTRSPSIILCGSVIS